MIVPFNDEAVALVSRIESGEDDSKVWRRVQKYVVSVYPYVLGDLMQFEAVRYISKDVCVLRDFKTFYDRDCGLHRNKDS